VIAVKHQKSDFQLYHDENKLYSMR